MKPIVLYALLLVSITSCKQEPRLIKVTGPVFGTSYSVLYESKANENYEHQFDSIFYIINKSMSNYQTNSDISKINRNELNTVDEHFETVFKASNKIYNETNGGFDPTIGKLVNAWDFGSEQKENALDSIKIDSMMAYVGFNKLSMKNRQLKKSNPNVYIDFNAIAKGYGVDAICAFLETKGINNYLVEIGGEIRAKGVHPLKQSIWRVGLQDPNFDGTISYKKTIALNDAAMATSGTYRKFKVDKNGNRYAHIINAKTGYPSKTNVLSVSVIANNCMLADGYATAFQAMGIKKTAVFLNRNPKLKVYFIYENSKKELKIIDFNNFLEQ